MSVLIKGIHLPESCMMCPCLSRSQWLGEVMCRCEAKCISFGKEDMIWIAKRRPNWCPMVDLGNHGDLIDRDALRAEFPEPNDMTDQHQALVHITGVWAMINCADTVIEAEDGT